MPWLCFSNSSRHVSNDLMKKPAPGSEMRDSQVPHVAAAALFRQVVEKDITALAVVLQYLQLRLPLPCPLAFLLLLFSLLGLRGSGHSGLTLGLFLLPFLLFLAFVCLAMVIFASSITAGGASPLLFNGWFSGLVWHEDFLAWHLFTLLGSILHGNILYQGTLGQCALG